MCNDQRWPPDFTASGGFVQIVPLAPAHEAELTESVLDGDLHRLWYTTVPHPDAVGSEIRRRLALRQSGSMQPFAVIGKDSGKAVGMTSYMNIDAVNRRVEIGSTWYRRAVQRGPVNTECKLLLLRHAFEALSCIAVEFRTHAMNIQSRRAIERLGAVLDGVLRAHSVLANGTIRNTAVYSVTAADWPSVRANLEWQMEKPRDEA